MVPDEGSPLPVNVLGQAGHVGIGMFAHLVHGVTWKTKTAPVGLAGGKKYNCHQSNPVGAKAATHSP